MVRIKSRWILFELIQDPIIQNDQVFEQNTPLLVNERMISLTLKQSNQITFGDMGVGMLKFTNVKWYNSETKTGILRVPREFTDMLLASMFFIKQIENMPCHFKILQVSGTIVFIQKYAIERDRSFYLKEQEMMEKQGKSFNIVDKIQTSTTQINNITR